MTASQKDQIPSQARKVIVAASLGTIVEWYDYALFGAAAGLVIGPLFFPEQGGTAGVLAALATFAVGFVVRPVGGVLLSNLGDRYGRKFAITTTILLMGIGTFGIGVLPTAAAIGIWAPVMLLILRVVQGFGAGAELTGAIVMVAESIPPRRRGLITAVVNSCSLVGILLATVVFLAASSLDDAAFMTWGWRLPFLASSVLFLLALYIRNNLSETIEFAAARTEDAALGVDDKRSAPIRELYTKYRARTVIGFFLWTGQNCIGYITFTFIVVYLTHYTDISRTSALAISGVGGLICIFMGPVFGYLGDRYGHAYVLIASSVATILFAVPFFALLQSGSIINALFATVIAEGIVVAAAGGVIGAIAANLFPTRVRYSGMTIGKELNAAVVAGPTPFIATALLGSNGEPWLVAAFVATTASMTLAALLAGRKFVFPPSKPESARPTPITDDNRQGATQ